MLQPERRKEENLCYVQSLVPKVWYREFSRISNIGIMIIEKWIAIAMRLIRTLHKIRL